VIKIDVHQHLWTEELVSALSVRSELPFVRQEHGLTVLYLAGERPYVIDLSSETPERRADLIEVDGLDRAVLCLSSPLGIEGLPREQSLPLLEAYHRGALALGGRFEHGAPCLWTGPIPRTSIARSSAAASACRCLPAPSRASTHSPACVPCWRASNSMEHLFSSIRARAWPNALIRELSVPGSATPCGGRL